MGFQALFVHSMVLFRDIGFRQGLFGGETGRLEQEYMYFEHILQVGQKIIRARIKMNRPAPSPAKRPKQEQDRNPAP